MLSHVVIAKKVIAKGGSQVYGRPLAHKGRVIDCSLAHFLSASRSTANNQDERLTCQQLLAVVLVGFFFFSSRRRHTRFLNVTGVQTCVFFFKQKTAYEISECDWSSECALPI